jgi:hypothetical protein
MNGKIDTSLRVGDPANIEWLDNSTLVIGKDPRGNAFVALVGVNHGPPSMPSRVDYRLETINRETYVIEATQNGDILRCSMEVEPSPLLDGNPIMMPSPIKKKAKKKASKGKPMKKKVKKKAVKKARKPTREETELQNAIADLGIWTGRMFKTPKKKDLDRIQTSLKKLSMAFSKNYGPEKKKAPLRVIARLICKAIDEDNFHEKNLDKATKAIKKMEKLIKKYGQVKAIADELDRTA